MHKALESSKTTGKAGRRTVRYAGAVLLTVTLAFAGAAGLGAMFHPSPPRPGAPATASASIPAWDPSRFMLNALLATALDTDAVPLRWTDPRAALHCGPNTAVLVNREPLRDGALVPDAPFELDWLADGCRPFGANGPRLDGRVRMTVFREDWGFSAMVEPLGFRVTGGRGEIALVHSCGASLPQDPAADDLGVLSDIDVATQRLPCR